MAELAADAAVRAADTVLVTVPNQLGVDFNARLLAAVADVMREVDAAPVPGLTSPFLPTPGLGLGLRSAGP